MYIKFTLEVGVGNRSLIRQNLQNSKKKLEFYFPKSSVLLIENEGFLESTFRFEAKGIPESAEPAVRKWLNSIKEFAD